MYANSRFMKKVNEWGRVEEWIEPGDKISQSDIGVSDDEWEYLCEVGAVVEKYPEKLKNSPQTPPAEYYKKNDPNAAPEGTDVGAAAGEQKVVEPPKEEPTKQTTPQGASENK